MGRDIKIINFVSVWLSAYVVQLLKKIYHVYQGPQGNPDKMPAVVSKEGTMSLQGFLEATFYNTNCFLIALYKPRS